MRRLALVALAFLALSLVPTEAASLLPPDDGTPVGWRAVENVGTYAMSFPGRAGELPTMLAARDELAARLDEMGYDVVRHEYSGNDPGTNILGILRGTTMPHEWIVVSAHYDVAITPLGGTGASLHGAWDDGSGVAAALEIARVAQMRSWERTLVIAFFDDEEAGLVGASRFLRDWEGRAWEGGTVRMAANVNMDPPGLHWPCMLDSGVVMPLALMQGRTTGAGATLLRESAFAAAEAEGVPDEALAFYHGSFPVAYVISGFSDNVAFGQRGIPDLYVGSPTHLGVAGATVQTAYPFHSPADDLATMVAYCGGPLDLAAAFDVAMGIVWRVVLDVDAHDGAYPRP